MGGSRGLDYGPAIAIIQDAGGRLMTVLPMLKVIEIAALVAKNGDGG